MRSSWRLAAPVLCVAAVFGAATIWQSYKAHANKVKLTEEARAYRQRAVQGDATAQAELANMYYSGQGVPQDYGEALRWYRKAADQGNAKGQYGLGAIYYHGQGVARDYSEALRWYRKAADQGDPKAENGIALIYSQGQGVSQDYVEALRWYGRAADRGYAKSEYNLGNMYYYGRGVPSNRAEAERWYQKAADQGDEYAQRALGLKWNLSSWSAITLWAMFLGCLWALKDAIFPQRNPQHHQPPALTIGGICGLLYIGLSLYGRFSVFKTLLTANMFHFLTNFVAGLSVAMFISVVAPKRAKIVLGISSVLLIGNDLPVISRHQLARFIMTVRAFSVINGLLIGLTVPLAVFLWLETKRKGHGGVHSTGG